MEMQLIANDLLDTYEGIEFLSLSRDSWFNVISDTMEFYNISKLDAMEAHSLALYTFTN